MHHLEEEKFGRLTVILYTRNYVTKNGSVRARWKCLCDCQKDLPEENRKYSYVNTQDLLSGKVLSCGCLHKEIVSKHGCSKTRLHQIWVDMRSRCRNPNLEYYYNYGGRGIDICPEWDVFENFKKWAFENGYNDTLTIDRINVDGDYEPHNCRWATIKEQENNKRNNICDYYEGELLTMMQFSKKINKGFSAIEYKFKKNNMSFEEIAKYFKKQDELCINVNNCNNSVIYSINNNKRHSDIISKIRRLLNNGILSDEDAILKNYLTAQKHYSHCYILSERAIDILNKKGV